SLPSLSRLLRWKRKKGWKRLASEVIPGTQHHNPGFPFCVERLGKAIGQAVSGKPSGVKNVPYAKRNIPFFVKQIFLNTGIQGMLGEVPSLRFNFRRLIIPYQLKVKAEWKLEVTGD